MWARWKVPTLLVRHLGGSRARLQRLFDDTRVYGRASQAWPDPWTETSDRINRRNHHKLWSNQGGNLRLHDFDGQLELGWRDGFAGLVGRFGGYPVLEALLSWVCTCIRCPHRYFGGQDDHGASHVCSADQARRFSFSRS